MNIDKLLSGINLVDELDDEELSQIGNDVVESYEQDKNSRKEWETQNDEWMRLALQVKEEKNYPWPKAANVKFPLLTTAALQFGARAYPSLVPSFDVVKAKPIGTDDANQAQEIAEKISTHMSYQIFYEMDNWEEEMDKLCFVLPIIGCCFKKTYYSPMKGHNCSELVLPKDLIVNYHAKSLEKASRKTHLLWLTPTEIKERQQAGIFRELEHDLGAGIMSQHASGVQDKVMPSSNDPEAPRCILEQHTRLDLDDDGYKEPYVVTVDLETREPLRIFPRFRKQDVHLKADDPNKVAFINATEYFTKYDFLPNPDGGFYGVGFGLLLGSLNESANTLINQLLDSGTLNNLQSGFVSKGLRIGKSGPIKLGPGEWQWVNNTGDDLKKGIFPLPTKEPSNVLFQLLGTIVQSGKELASIAEIFTGKMPGQNTPASTTMATIEQGLKVFTSIYKRIYRSLGQEFEKLFALNAVYLEEGEQKFTYERDGVVTDQTISGQLYQQAKMKIVPAADPNMVSETQKLIKFQGLMELMQFGTLSPQEVTKRGLEMQGQTGIAKLMEAPPPPEDPKITIAKMEMQLEEKKLQLEQMKVMSESQKRQSEITLNIAKAKQLGDSEGALMLEAQLKREEQQMDLQVKLMELIMKREEHSMEMKHKQEEHQLDKQVKQSEAAMNLQMKAQDVAFKERTHGQKLVHGEEAHQLKLKQTKEKAKNVPKERDN
jgi:chaperonin GroES